MLPYAEVKLFYIMDKSELLKLRISSIVRSDIGENKWKLRRNIW